MNVIPKFYPNYGLMSHIAQKKFKERDRESLHSEQASDWSFEADQIMPKEAQQHFTSSSQREQEPLSPNDSSGILASQISINFVPDERANNQTREKIGQINDKIAKKEKLINAKRS